MKKLLLATLSVIAALPLWAKGTTWNIQGTNYHVDTTYHATIGPGTTRTSVVLSQGKRPLNIFYTTTDLSNPYNDVRVVKGKGMTTGCEVMSRQALRNDKAGARYFAGINANFFANLAPVGSCVGDGIVYRINNVGKYTAFYVTKDKKPGLHSGFSGTVSFPDGTLATYTGINGSVGTNQTQLFNKYFGTTTGTNEWCAEVAVEVESGTVGFAGRATLRVVSEPKSSGNSTIPATGFILAGHGSANTKIMNLKVGDLINLNANSALSGLDITQVVDGNCKILENGVTLNTANWDNMSSALHPRTVIGYGDGGKKVVMMIVDGRSAISGGMMYMELADLMKAVGCTDAINLDGGGSTELYTSAHGFVNHPSDGNERAVTNSIWNVATSPDDNEIASIAFERQVVDLPVYGFYQPVIYGYNKYGVLVDAAVTGYTLSAPEALGQIRNEGATLFADGSGTHALTATLPGGISATCVVTVATGTPHLRLSEVLVDSYRDYTAEVITEIDGLEMPIDNVALSWSSEDAAIATVDEKGKIHGVANGKTNITGTIGDITLTLPVTVDIPDHRYIPAADPAKIAEWTTSGNNVKVNSITPVDGNPSAFDVTYTVTSSRLPSATIRFNSDMRAFPDSLRVVVNPGSCKLTSLRLSVSPKGGKATHITVDAPVADKDNVYLLPIKDFFDVNEIANFPAQFTQLTFYTSEPVQTNGTFRVQSANGVYTAIPADDAGVTDIVADDDNTAPVRYYNLQGMPVRPATAGAGVYIRRQGNRSTKILIH